METGKAAHQARGQGTGQVSDLGPSRDLAMLAYQAAALERETWARLAQACQEELPGRALLLVAALGSQAGPVAHLVRSWVRALARERPDIQARLVEAEGVLVLRAPFASVSVVAARSESAVLAALVAPAAAGTAAPDSGAPAAPARDGEPAAE